MFVDHIVNKRGLASPVDPYKLVSGTIGRWGDEDQRPILCCREAGSTEAVIPNGTTCNAIHNWRW
jgi:hypothetical protein